MRSWRLAYNAGQGRLTPAGPGQFCGAARRDRKGMSAKLQAARLWRQMAGGAALAYSRRWRCRSHVGEQRCVRLTIRGASKNKDKLGRVRAGTQPGVPRPGQFPGDRALKRPRKIRRQAKTKPIRRSSNAARPGNGGWAVRDPVVMRG